MCGAKTSDLLNKPLNVVWTCLCLLAQNPATHELAPASAESLDVYAPDAVASGKETADGSSKVGSDICVVPDMLQTAVSVTTVVTEKWMERFVLDLDDLRSDVLASGGEDPAGGSSDVGSDVCVVPDLLPTVVSVGAVVAEKWME